MTRRRWRPLSRSRIRRMASACAMNSSAEHHQPREDVREELARVVAESRLHGGGPRALHAHRQPAQPLQARQAAARLEEAAGDRGHLVCRRLAIRLHERPDLRHRLERLGVEPVADERRHLDHAARDLRTDGLDRVRIEAELGPLPLEHGVLESFRHDDQGGRLAALEQPRRLGLVRHLRQLEEVLRGPAGKDLRQGARHERVVLVEEQHRGRRQRSLQPRCARRRRTR